MRPPPAPSTSARGSGAGGPPGSRLKAAGAAFEVGPEGVAGAAGGFFQGGLGDAVGGLEVSGGFPVAGLAGGGAGRRKSNSSSRISSFLWS